MKLILPIRSTRAFSKHPRALHTGNKFMPFFFPPVNSQIATSTMFQSTQIKQLRKHTRIAKYWGHLASKTPWICTSAFKLAQSCKISPSNNQLTLKPQIRFQETWCSIRDATCELRRMDYRKGTELAHLHFLKRKKDSLPPIATFTSTKLELQKLF